MSPLFNALQAYTSPELVQSAAQMLGEKELGVSKAIGCIVPTILAGLLEKSGETAVFNEVFEGIRAFDPKVLQQLGNLLGSGNLAQNDPKDLSGALLGTVFGTKMPAIINAVASFSGIKQSAASSLLGLGGPLTLGFLSKKIQDDGLDRSGFVQLLQREKPNILLLLPYNIHALLSNRNTQSLEQETSKKQEEPEAAWLWALLLLLGLGAGIVWCIKHGM